jgi:hypothetical protein
VQVCVSKTSTIKASDNLTSYNKHYSDCNPPESRLSDDAQYLDPIPTYFTLHIRKPCLRNSKYLNDGMYTDAVLAFPSNLDTRSLKHWFVCATFSMIGLNLGKHHTHRSQTYSPSRLSSRSRSQLTSQVPWKRSPKVICD